MVMFSIPDIHTISPTFASSTFALPQTLDLAYGNDLAVIRLRCFVVIADDNGLIYLDNASFNTADTCSAHIIVIVDRGDEHLHGAVLVALGCGDIVEDSIEKGLQVCACLILAEGSRCLHGLSKRG